MTRPRVMFVDDEPSVLEALRRALRPQLKAWDCAFFEDPWLALNAFGERPFDVVVSDLAMPGMNGLELVLKMKEASTSCAFIMLTGTGDLPQAVAAINQAQVFRFFTKPCAAELLVEGISAALAEAASRAALPDAAADPPGQLTAIVGLAALNRVAFGVLVVDSKARVLLANRTGGEILAERDGLLLSAGEILRAGTSLATERLFGLVRTATKTSAENEEEDDTAVGIALERPSGKRPLNVLLCAAPEAGELGQGPPAILFVSDPDRRPLPSADAIGRFFALTPSEAKLVHALTEGLRLDEAAGRCGWTVETARTYLKKVFGKTGTRRQPELVRLVLTSPALVA